MAYLWGNTYKSYFDKTCQTSKLAIRVFPTVIIDVILDPYLLNLFFQTVTDMHFQELGVFMYKFFTNDVP